MESIASPIKTKPVSADRESMKLNNRERFAILIGIAWWLTLAYYAVTALWRWLT